MPLDQDGSQMADHYQFVKYNMYFKALYIKYIKVTNVVRLLYAVDGLTNTQEQALKGKLDFGVPYNAAPNYGSWQLAAGGFKTWRLAA